MRSLLPWCTAIVIVIADRVTKILVLEHIPVGGWRAVVPGVALTHVHNRGIAFSLFSEGGWLSRVVLHGVILTAVVLIAWMLFRHGHRQPMAGLAFGLILGGAVGNLVDRVMYGWVIDFIHVWVRVGERSWAWPDFNVADSAITVGACLLILNEFLIQRRGTDDASDSD
jgi:signal peptidase II